MPRDPQVYLEDMLEAIERIRRFTDGMDLAAFRDNALTVDAVLHNLEVIGEAAKSVPDSLRTKAPDVEWRKVTGMRDMIAHAYFDVDLEIVWDVVSAKLAPLESQLRRLLATGAG